MTEPARIEFRGVCLFVPRTEDLVHVLMPSTDRSLLPRAKEHFAYLTIYTAGGAIVDRPISIAGKALSIEANGTPPKLEPGELRFPRLIKLKTLVKNGAKVIVPTGVGGNVAAMVTVKGGASWKTMTASEADWVTDETQPHNLGAPDLEVGWEGKKGERIRIQIENEKPRYIEPGQTAVIGHYDDTSDSAQRRIKDREVDWVEKWVDDGDFVWLYRLLDPQPVAQPVPRTFEPSGWTLKALLHKLGLDTSPLTTTCFGATWEPEE